MAIFCPKCGKELPDDAQFCMKCGKSLTPVSQEAPQPEPTWEYCEIQYDRSKIEEHFIGETDYYLVFWADGVGPNGTFNAGAIDIPKGHYSQPWSDVDSHLAAHRQIVDLLLSDGWEVLPNRGPAWFSYKFRRQVLARDDKAALDWRKKGNDLIKQDRKKEALAAYSWAARLNPEDAHSWVMRGILLAQLDMYRPALKSLEEALRLNPKSAPAWYWKGFVLTQTGGTPSEVLQAINQAIACDPKYGAAWEMKGMLLKAMGRKKEAEQAFQRARELGQSV